MARNVTLSGLRDRIYELGELREAYVSKTALREEINQSIAELYDLVVQADQGYYESTDTITVVSGTASYSLPTDYYKTIGVDVQRSDGSTWINLRRYNHTERNKYSNYGGGINREWTEYRVRGGNIVFTPSPTWSGSARHFYIPTPTKLTDDGDTFDGVAGWDDYVVYDCLVKFVGGKEEGDAAVWQSLFDKAQNRIEQMSRTRDFGEPSTIRDLDEEEAERLWPRLGPP